jgi:hypothetical protein
MRMKAYVVAWLLKAGIAEPEQMSVAKPCHGKRMPSAVLFSVWSMLNLYNKDQWDKVRTPCVLQDLGPRVTLLVKHSVNPFTRSNSISGHQHVTVL